VTEKIDTISIYWSRMNNMMSIISKLPNISHLFALLCVTGQKKYKTH